MGIAPSPSLFSWQQEQFAAVLPSLVEPEPCKQTGADCAPLPGAADVRGSRKTCSLGVFLSACQSCICSSRGIAAWLLEEKNLNNFCHVEEEGAEKPP